MTRCPLTRADRINVLTLDDSIYHHARSKKVEQRECKDARSLGELFYLSVDELPDVCFVEAMRLLLLLFVERLQEKPMLDEGKIHEQLQGFLKELPVLLSQKLRKCA